MSRQWSAVLALVIGGMTASAWAETALFPEAPIDCVVRPREIIELSSLEEGVLTTVLVERGDRVSRGQVVAQLESDLQASAVELARIRAGNKAPVEAGEARVTFRTDEVERLRSLHKKRVATSSSLDEAEVELRLAELELESVMAEMRIAEADLAQAELRLARRGIRSPVEGLVTAVNSAPGEFVHEQASVLTIAALDPLYVEAYLPIALFPDLATGQEAEVAIADPIGETRVARVKAIDRVFDAASATFGVRLELANGDGSLPGGIKCTLRIRTSPGDG